ncbi:MAG: F0F1 ATP synthase subunit A [Planctomycetaceae bacterium]|nr:F0F1 ATP synthase subunit A [Planctomycetaceae bacterium]
MLLAADDHSDTFHHVRDFDFFELPFGYHLEIPAIGGFQPTKFMVLQVVTFLLVVFIFRGLARRVASGQPVKGRWWNFWETLALFIRDDMVRPIIGDPDAHHGHDDHGRNSHGPDYHGEPLDTETEHMKDVEREVTGHDEITHEKEGADLIHVGDHTLSVAVGHPADKYLPFVWSCFFYVLISNLLGAIPSMGTATSSINVTGALALVVFCAVVFYGAQRSGFVGFWLSQAPSMDLPGVMGYIIVPVIWAIEVVGLFIKHIVLAIRLFANIMGGHTVLAVILSFIAVSADHGAIWYAVTPASVFGQLAIGLLELFVAFVQAYVFSIMATLFISAAVNPH